MKSLVVYEPSSGDVLAEVRRTEVSQLDEIVEQARRAQHAWAETAPEYRAGVLNAIAGEIERNAEELAVIESRDVGMPLRDTRGVAAGAAATFRYYAGAVERNTGITIPVAGGVDMTFREPLGVVGLITPWNFPLSIACWKIAPALAAGNAVILKPAELAPLSALELQRLVTRVGLPEGLLNVVIGPGRTVGSSLVEHPGIAKLAFTGSTAVGRDILRRSAVGIKRVTLELGGKSASLIFADADLEAATQGLVGGSFGNSGQDCCARSRVFVEESAMPEVLERIEQVVAGVVVGDPLEESTVMGPLISSAHRDVVQGYVDQASVLFQGEAPTGKGNWFPPTVLNPVTDDHLVAREEIFGPVITLHSFASESEAIRRANDTIYGLSGSVWTSDAARSLRVARQIQAGALAVNSYNSVRISTPFGGFKQSGLGRELGPHALHAYSELKNVYFDTGVAR